MNTRTMVAVVALLGTPTAALADDWFELRSSATGSRFSSESSGPTFSPSWTYRVRNGGQILSTPVSVDGTVLTSSTSGDIASLDLQNGGERWARVLDGSIGGTPAVHHGRIVVSTRNGQLYGLRLNDGQLTWQQPFGGVMNYSSPVRVSGADGRSSVILPAGFPSQDVSRIDFATGKVAWRTERGIIEGLVYTSAAVVRQHAIVGMNGGRYQSLNTETGATRWKFDPGGAVYLSSALVDGETVYMFPGNEQSQLFAVDVDTGLPRAGFPVSIPDPAPVKGYGMLDRGPAISSPMMAGGLVIVQLRRQDILDPPNKTFRVAMREYVVGVDPRAGTVVWQHELASVIAPDLNGVPELQACATPAGFSTGASAVVAVSSSISPRVAVLDVATGTELWSAALSSPGRSSPAFSNGQLLVGTDAGVLHAFGSTVNRAPAAPTTVAATIDPAMGGISLHWDAATDPEGERLSYIVRVVEEASDAPMIDTATEPDTTTLSIAPKEGVTYQVAVRSRDPKGALSPWSASQSIRATTGQNVVPILPPETTIVPIGVEEPAPGAAREAPAESPPQPNSADVPPAVGCAMGGKGRPLSGVWVVAAFVALALNRKRPSPGPRHGPPAGSLLDRRGPRAPSPPRSKA